MIELKAVSENFLDLMWIWEQDKSVRDGIGESKLLSLEQFKINKSKFFYEPNNILGIYNTNTEMFVGWFILENIDFSSSSLTLHSCMGDKETQKSINVIRAFEKILYYIFNELMIRNIITYTIDGNDAARKIVLKYKFREVGKFKMYTYDKKDVYIYQLVKKGVV